MDHWAVNVVFFTVEINDVHGDEGTETEAWLVYFSGVDVSFSFHSQAPLIELLRGSEKVLRDLLQLRLFVRVDFLAAVVSIAELSEDYGDPRSLRVQAFL